MKERLPLLWQGDRCVFWFIEVWVNLSYYAGWDTYGKSDEKGMRHMENHHHSTWSWLHSDYGGWHFAQNLWRILCFICFVFFQVEFLDLCQFPSYSQTGYRGLEKGFHCEDSLLHVLTPAPLPVLFPLPSSPPALLSPIPEPTMTRVSLYPPSYCHHLSMWLSPESTTLSIEQVSFQNLIWLWINME